MNIKPVLFLIIFFFGSIHGQKIDSLWTVYGNVKQADTLRIKTLYKIAEFYNNSKNDSAKPIIDTLLKQARASNNINVIILSWLAKARYTLQTGDNIESQKYFYQANSLAKKFNLKSFQGAALIGLGNIAAQTDRQQALNYYLQSVNYALLAKDTLQLFRVYSNISIIYGLMGENNQAITYNFKALSVGNTIKNNKKIQIKQSGLLQDIGSYYFREDNYDQSIKYHFLSIELASKINYLDILPPNYYSIGTIYDELKEFKKVLPNYLKGYGYAKKIANKEYEARGEYLIGTYYNEFFKNDKKAHEYLFLALKKYEAIGDKEGEFKILKALGVIALKADDMKTCFFYFNKELSVVEKINYQEGIMFAYADFGDYYLNVNQPKKSIEYYKQALEIAIQLDDKSTRGEICEALSQAYQKNKNINLAFDYYKQHILYRDSVLGNQTKNNVKQLTIKHQYETKLITDSLKNKVEQQFNQSKIKQANVQKNYLLIVISIIALLIVVIYNRYRVVRKQKIVIEKTLKEKEMLIAEVHHRVKNNLQLINSLLELQSINIKDDSARNAIIESQQRVLAMATIHQKLYKEDDILSVKIDSYIKELAENLIDSLSVNSILLTANLNACRVNIDTAIPIGLIINELIINSIKYAFQKTEQPEITISFVTEESSYVLSISDNGKGYDNAVQNNSSTSFGLKLVKSLTSQLNAQYTFDKINGYNHIFKIPIAA